MIVTFTANPSLDRTIVLEERLVRGAVHRAASTRLEAGGKGVNVARVLSYAGLDVVPVLSLADESIIRELAALGMSASYPDNPDGLRVRTNITLAESDGTTTKVNEPGPLLTRAHVEAATERLLDAARGASWVALSGSLPPGAPADWYATLVPKLKALGCRVAVDTSDAPLQAVVEALPGIAFDLIKPNSDEVAQLTGGDPVALEESARRGDPGPVVNAARALQARGITNVLATLGGAGAVLVTSDGAWFASAPPITVRSTVGAGDSSVAGFLLADSSGLPPERALQYAIAHGSAAAGLEGTSLPRPTDVDPDAVRVTRLG